MGTKSYIAPEIGEGETYNGKKVDMYAIGVIIYVIVLGHFPFNKAHKYDYNYKLFKE